VADLAKALRQGYVYDGRYAPSRERSHGNSPDRIRNDQIVVAAQTHDQVGNRMLGERLTALVDFDGLKLAAGTLILAPFIPLLFMGEEYGESAPFLYFTSHTDQSLIDAVRQGRRTELAAFEWQGEPPDPDDPLTFRRCRLDHQLRKSGSHRALWDFHRELIRLRREVEPLARLQRASVEVEARPTEGTILMRRVGRISDALVLLNYSPHAVSWPLPAQGRGWARLLDSAEERWLGMGSSAATEIDAEQETIEVAPRSFLVYLSRT
jgi:maltooligosyltrehalose trehalohydrolase